jgi:putative endopeptidase
MSQNEHGIKPDYMDTTANPGVDFNQYANGGWIARTEIPPEYPRWGAFLMLAESTLVRCHDLLKAAAARTDAPAGSVEQMVGDFFHAAMDEAKIEADGVTPLEAEFKRIAAIRSRRSLADALAQLHLYGINALFSFGSGTDFDNSSQVIAHAVQGGLGLPDRDYYLEADNAELRDKYVAHVQRMFELLGERKHDARRHAQAVLSFETALAAASMSKVERRDPDNLRNKMTVDQFADLFAGFPVRRYFEKLGAPAFDTLNVMQPNFFRGASALLDTPLWKIKAYLRWNLIRAASSYLSSAFVTENFEFYGKTLTGSKEQKPRWKRAIGMVNGSLGEALGQLYVAKHFPPEAKARMLELVANIKEALAEAINAADWMSDETRRNALIKLGTFEAMIGYPDKWTDYSGLTIDRKSLIGNELRTSEFENRHDLQKIGKPVDRTEWGMAPQTVNAYYSPQKNQIVFPAAILQPPFFDAEADDAANYGGIGVVIGHEITHGFDDKGCKYDEVGNVRNWWTAEDHARFSARVQIIIEQFNGFTVSGGKSVNGKLVAGEASSDLGGVRLGIRALKKVLEQTGRRTINGFTDEQRFFLAFAQLWAGKATPEYEQMQVATDPHPPGKYRVNGTLAHVPEFAAAFGMKEEECPLLLPPDKRCQIW